MERERPAASELEQIEQPGKPGDTISPMPSNDR